MPHEVLELSPYELTLAWLCYVEANSAAAMRIKQADGMVFPVVNMGG
jgi:hypothetical protein